MRELPDGSRVGSVRFRALDLPVRLHPQIQPHLPLSITVHDRESGRSVEWNYDRASEEAGAIRILHVGEGNIAASPGRDSTDPLDLLDID